MRKNQSQTILSHNLKKKFHSQ